MAVAFPGVSQFEKGDAPPLGRRIHGAAKV